MTLPILDEHTAAHVAELFRSFSDTSRVRILAFILGAGKIDWCNRICCIPPHARAAPDEACKFQAGGKRSLLPRG
jgi:hypothetical protein